MYFIIDRCKNNISFLFLNEHQKLYSIERRLSAEFERIFLPAVSQDKGLIYKNTFF